MSHSDQSFVPLESLTSAASLNAPASDAETPSRRRFLELVGASLAAAGAGCTRMPTEFIMPYVEPPENAIPGRPSYYATASIVNGLAQGIVVESHLGRPTKIEGNPHHPASLGATDVHGQSCVLDLAKLKTEKLDYPLLGSLNTRPRTTYMAELRNPNPELNPSPGPKETAG